MKFGCHLVMFTDLVATEPEKVLKSVAATGFSGVEVGNRFLPLEGREKFMELLRENDLELSAIHVNAMGAHAANYADWRGDYKGVFKIIEDEARFMSQNSSKNINMSFGVQLDDDYIRLAELFNEAALICKDYGVSFNYHSHGNDFLEHEKFGKFQYVLLEHAPDLRYALDLGWVYRAGKDPLEMLKDAAGRCDYVHFRDPDDGPVNGIGPFGPRYFFPDLGSGIMDLKGQLEFLQNYLSKDGWVVVEYEGGEPDPDRYVKAKKHIDNLLQ